MAYASNISIRLTYLNEASIGIHFFIGHIILCRLSSYNRFWIRCPVVRVSLMKNLLPSQPHRMTYNTSFPLQVRRLTKKKNHDIEMDLDMGAAAAFPDSPGNGHGGHTNRGARVASGHFPIPRFDSIRGRFDSGIFASTTTGGGNYSSQNIGARGAATSALDDGKAHLKDSSIASTATALSTPSGSGSRSSPNGPRSTVLDRGLVAKGFTTSDVGRPVSGAINETHEERTGTVGQRASGWGAAMSGEYPDLDGADPYAGENTLMVETGTHSRRGSQSGF